MGLYYLSDWTLVQNDNLIRVFDRAQPQDNTLDYEQQTYKVPVSDDENCLLVVLEKLWQGLSN